MNGFIDLRSDTVTQPTQEMREAIYRAEVGDDIMGEDPTVRKLEELAADLFNKEAGLFLPSGTMANQVAVMTYTQRGDEVLLGDSSHLFNLECGAIAALSQVQVRSFPVPNGIYPVAQIREMIRVQGIQQPHTSLICIENSCDLNTGMVVPMENLEELQILSEEKNIPIFLDGARIFNASVASGISLSNLTEGADSLMFALTKGLSAPFGAVLLGKKSWIEKARWHKQRLGGGFRQAGFLAAAGIVALEKMIPRIEEDHEHAQLLGQGLSKIPKLKINLDLLHTNIVPVYLDEIEELDELVDELQKKRIIVKRISPNSIRMVTHRGISTDSINYVIDSFEDILKKG